MIGIIAERCRGRLTLPTEYWNNSPTLEASLIAETLSAGLKPSLLAWHRHLCVRHERSLLEPPPCHRSLGLHGRGCPRSRRGHHRHGRARTRRRLPLVIFLRTQRSVQLRHHGGTRHVERLVKVLLEGNGTSAHEAQTHILPVVVRLVFHDGPALQRRLFLRCFVCGGVTTIRHDEPIAGFPDGCLHDVAQPHAALALAVELDVHRLFILVTRARQRGEGLVQLLLQTRVLQLDFADLLQLDGTKTVRSHEVDELLLQRRVVLASRRLAFFNPEDDAGEVFRAVGSRVGQRHLRAAQFVEQITERWIVADIDLERGERLRQGILRGVGHNTHATTIEVLKDEALEDVVDLRRLEAQFRRGVAAQTALMLEKADAAGEKHDLAHGDVHGGGSCGGGRGIVHLGKGVGVDAEGD